MAATVFLNIDLIEQPALIQHKLLLEAVTSHILRDEIFCNASSMCKTPLPILFSLRYNSFIPVLFNIMDEIHSTASSVSWLHCKLSTLSDEYCKSLPCSSKVVKHWLHSITNAISSDTSLSK